MNAIQPEPAGQPHAIRELRDLFTERLLHARRRGPGGDLEALVYRQALRDLHEEFIDLLKPEVSAWALSGGLRCLHDPV